MDSGASFDFISTALADRLGWAKGAHEPVNIRLADGSSIQSTAACTGLINIGQLRHVMTFLVLDLAFDMVLGSSWL